MKALAIAALAIAAAAGAPAFATDFTFDIPVTFDNVPSVVSASVNCYVSKVLQDGVAPAAGTNVVGRGSTLIQVHGGSYHGTVTVTVNADGLIPASDAKSYACTMDVSGRGRSPYNASAGNASDVYFAATGVHLDRVVMLTSANLP